MRKHIRPEENTRRGDEYYDFIEAKRYSECKPTQRIQSELATHAVNNLLGLSPKVGFPSSSVDI